MTHCPPAAPSEMRAELYERLAAIVPPGLDRVLRHHGRGGRSS